MRRRSLFSAVQRDKERDDEQQEEAFGVDEVEVEGGWEGEEEDEGAPRGLLG